MAPTRKPPQFGAKRTGQAGNWGRPLGEPIFRLSGPAAGLKVTPEGLGSGRTRTRENARRSPRHLDRAPPADAHPARQARRHRTASCARSQAVSGLTTGDGRGRSGLLSPWDGSVRAVPAHPPRSFRGKRGSGVRRLTPAAPQPGDSSAPPGRPAPSRHEERRAGTWGDPPNRLHHLLYHRTSIGMTPAAPHHPATVLRGCQAVFQHRRLLHRGAGTGRPLGRPRGRAAGPGRGGGPGRLRPAV